MLAAPSSGSGLPAGNGVLGHRRVGKRAKFSQRRLRMLQPQPSRSQQMLRDPRCSSPMAACTRATPVAAACAVRRWLAVFQLAMVLAGACRRHLPLLPGQRPRRCPQLA